VEEKRPKAIPSLCAALADSLYHSFWRRSFGRMST